MARVGLCRLNNEGVAAIRNKYREGRWSNVAAFCHAIGIPRSTYYELIGREQWFEQETIQDKLRAFGIRDQDQTRYCDFRNVEVASSPPKPGCPNNLPGHPTSFIGREEEKATVKRLLVTTSLLTLTGAGGCGKTRLALQVATELCADYPDGVRVVELADLTDTNLVPQALLMALDRQEEAGRSYLETSTAYLKPKRLLLILDNCEHLVIACAQLATLLIRECPQVKILATSREPLGISGETLWRVLSLSQPDRAFLPSAAAELTSEWAGYDAIRLFVERARAARADFALDGQNGPHIVEICRRLDGMPLAIELAAVRVRVLSVAQISSRLDDCFRLLTGGSRTALPRQQTLRALIDWSYDLLTTPERVLLQRLAVFSGGWTLEAAEQVCAGADIVEGEVLPILASLVDKSLVVFEERESRTRYRFLEAIRQYAEERLLASDDAEGLLEKHVAFFLELAEDAEPKLSGSEQRYWLQRLEEEYENLRAAMGGCLSRNEVVVGLQFCGALARFWRKRAHFTEGREWCARFLGTAEGQEQTRERARVLLAVSNLALFLGDSIDAGSHLNESLTIYRQTGDRSGIARALGSLGHWAYNTGDYASARAYWEESLVLHEEIGDRSSIALVLNGLGTIALVQTDYISARSYLEESLVLHRALGDLSSVAWTLGNLGGLALNQGDTISARAYCEESLTLFRETRDVSGLAWMLGLIGVIAVRQRDHTSARSYLTEGLVLFRESGNQRGIVESLEGFAGLAANERRFERAVVLRAVAATLREEIDYPIRSSEQEAYSGDLEALRQALGEEAFTTLWSHSAAMPLQQGIAYALGETDHSL